MDVTSVLIGKDFMCFIIANILLSKLPILFYSIYQKQKQFSAERVEVKRAFRRYCCDFFLFCPDLGSSSSSSSLCAADRKFA